jgi:hypothetical protein
MADKNFSSLSNDSFDTNTSTINGIRYSPSYINENKAKAKLKKDALEFVDYHKEYQSDPKYKTEMCKSWSESGFCAYGNKCRFAHGKDELFGKIVSCKKYKQKDCMSFFKNNYCCYGSRCHFRHQEKKLKDIDRSYYNYLLSNLANTTEAMGDVLSLDNDILMLVLSVNKPARSGPNRVPLFSMDNKRQVGKKEFQVAPSSKFNGLMLGPQSSSSLAKKVQANVKTNFPNDLTKEQLSKSRKYFNIIENSEKTENFSLSYCNYILPLF